MPGRLSDSKLPAPARHLRPQTAGSTGPPSLLWTPSCQGARGQGGQRPLSSRPPCPSPCLQVTRAEPSPANLHRPSRVSRRLRLPGAWLACLPQALPRPGTAARSLPVHRGLRVRADCLPAASSALSPGKRPHCSPSPRLAPRHPGSGLRGHGASKDPPAASPASRKLNPAADASPGDGGAQRPIYPCWRCRPAWRCLPTGPTPGPLPTGLPTPGPPIPGHPTPGHLTPGHPHTQAPASQCCPEAGTEGWVPALVPSTGLRVGGKGAETLCPSSLTDSEQPRGGAGGLSTRRVHTGQRVSPSPPRGAGTQAQRLPGPAPRG